MNTTKTNKKQKKWQPHRNNHHYLNRTLSTVSSRITYRWSAIPPYYTTNITVSSCYVLLRRRMFPPHHAVPVSLLKSVMTSSPSSHELTHPSSCRPRAPASPFLGLIWGWFCSFRRYSIRLLLGKQKKATILDVRGPDEIASMKLPRRDTGRLPKTMHGSIWCRAVPSMRACWNKRRLACYVIQVGQLLYIAHMKAIGKQDKGSSSYWMGWWASTSTNEFWMLEGGMRSNKKRLLMAGKSDMINPKRMQTRSKIVAMLWSSFSNV
jgi:hypothetical protein